MQPTIFKPKVAKEFLAINRFPARDKYELKANSTLYEL